MKSNLYQKLAIASLISVLGLIFAGAIVRVSGSGMGCPDWPTCWGLLIPPTNVNEVDFSKLPIEKFQRKAERMGRDSSLITQETLRQEFNPRHVWTEFINRLCAVVVGFLTLATFIVSFGYRNKKPKVFWLSFAALFLVLANAIMGARVVFSGLSPGVLTIHLALAMLLICVLTYCVWAGTDHPHTTRFKTRPRALRAIVLTLLAATVIEGIMGSQIREMTDKLAKFNLDSPRETWIAELESSVVYLIHRSFSWLILVITIWAFTIAAKSQERGPGPTQYTVLAIMVSQMLLGLIMSQIHIYSWVQVLHVGLAAILLSSLVRWFLLIPKEKNPPALADGC
jgi:cytochrome c oxidase assembly protein subunit 15